MREGRLLNLCDGDHLKMIMLNQLNVIDEVAAFKRDSLDEGFQRFRFQFQSVILSLLIFYKIKVLFYLRSLQVLPSVDHRRLDHIN